MSYREIHEKMEWKMSHGKNGALLVVIHTAGWHTPGSVAPSTLVVDLQDKYYSEKLDYRYRPPPNVDSCASADRSDPPTCASEKLFRDYHTDLLDYGIQSRPFLQHLPDRDTSRIFRVSQPHARRRRRGRRFWRTVRSRIRVSATRQDLSPTTLEKDP